MTALYEIATQHNQALSEMADIEDLSQDVIDDTMEMMEGEFKDKALSVAAFLQNTQADILGMKDAEKRIAVRRKSMENKIAWIKQYLLDNMERTDITKIECPEFKISMRNNPDSVIINNESSIPPEYTEVVKIIKIDKMAIKKAGGCEGVEIVKTKSVVIK